MNPLFFGPPESPLYGVYQPPQGPPRRAGVVLCYPFGQEYMRAHRAFRQLALLLTGRGFHVLRFDYRGTGDSSGDLDRLQAEDWIDDVGTAITELRELSGTPHVSLLGLRLGALVAAAACCHGGASVENLLLWDPVLSGDEYAAELIEQIHTEAPVLYGAPPGNEVRSDGTIHYNGFTLPSRFRASLARLDLLTMPLPPAQVFQVVSHETPAFSKLRDTWRAGAARFRYQYTPAPHDWNYVDEFGGILLPQPVIQSLVAWLDSEVAA